jgi:hypothetical protein
MHSQFPQLCYVRIINVFLILFFLAPGSNPQVVLREASTRIRAKYNFYEMTLQVEEFEEDMDDCNQCKPPTL